MQALALNDILKINDLPIAQVEVPQWGGTVGVRTLRAKERSEIERLAVGGTGASDPGKFRRLLLKQCLAAPDGSQLLAGDAEATAFMDKSAAAVEVLFEAALRINGIGPKDVEELEKN